MSYFYLPKLYPPVTNTNIEIISIKDEENTENEHYLHSLKSINDEIIKYKGYEVIQNLLTPYSLLNLIIKDKTLSLEYLLFTELFNLTKISVDSPIKSIHFGKNDYDNIKSLIMCRCNNQDVHYLTTNHSDLIPQVRRNPNINNNIFNKNVYNYINLELKNTFDFVTIMDCDNYDSNGNNTYILNVLLSIYMLKTGSNLVFKIPNIYSKENIDLLYFVSNYFEKTVIIKPNITTYFNNNKYICCKNMLTTTNRNFIKVICDKFYKFYTINNKNNNQNKLSGFLKIFLPTNFLSKIDECNSITAQSLIDNNCYLHNICKLNQNSPCNQKLSDINEKNKTKCINWCISNGIDYIE